jgi:Cu/Ag efflux pump CusA
MAVTIVGGLAVATVLTMVVVPVLYAILFKAKKDDAVGVSTAPVPAE